MTKLEILKDIIEIKNPSSILVDIASYEDNPEIIGFEVLKLDESNIRHLIELFMQNVIDQKALYEWSYFFEMKESVEYNPDTVGQALFILGTPEIYGGATQKLVSDALRVLNA